MPQNLYIGSDDEKATKKVIKRSDKSKFEHEGGNYDGVWTKRAGRKTQSRIGRTNPDNTKKVSRGKSAMTSLMNRTGHTYVRKRPRKSPPRKKS